MICNICGSDEAYVRLCEIPTAIITQRAHIDCLGHSQYRAIDRRDLFDRIRLCEVPHLILHLDTIYDISVDDSCDGCLSAKGDFESVITEAARDCARRRWNGIAAGWNQWPDLGEDEKSELTEKELFRFRFGELSRCLRCKSWIAHSETHCKACLKRHIRLEP